MCINLINLWYVCMKIVFNNIIFCGKTRYLSCDSDGKRRRISDCPYGRNYFGDTRGLIDFVKRYSYSNAYIEETVGRFHENNTYQIYITDPKESVNDLIRQNYDYIVFDKEPAFPDLETYYYDSVNIKKRVKELKDYFLRLITTNDKHLSEVELANKNVRLADEFMQIYEEGLINIEQINTLKSKIKNKTERIANIENDIILFTKELAKKKKCLSNHKVNLEKNNNKLNTNDKTTKSDIKKQEIENKREKILSRIENIEARILYLEKFLFNAPERILTLKKEIINHEELLEILKKSIKPNFSKLINFYKQNGIKIIK